MRRMNCWTLTLAHLYIYWPADDTFKRMMTYFGLEILIYTLFTIIIIYYIITCKGYCKVPQR